MPEGSCPKKDGNGLCVEMNMRMVKIRKLALKVLVLAAMGLPSTAVNAQKTEHYNSPLYSPRYYDPSESTTNGLPDALQKIGIEQKLGAQMPLDTELKDEDGSPVTLGSYFNHGRPVILAFVYYECPMLCNQVLNGLTGSLKGIAFNAGKDFDVVAISFDARENDKTDLAKKQKSELYRAIRPCGFGKWVAFSDRNTRFDR